MANNYLQLSGKFHPKHFDPRMGGFFGSWAKRGGELAELQRIFQNFSAQASGGHKHWHRQRRKQGTEALFGAIFGISSGKLSIGHNRLIIQNNTWTIKLSLKRLQIFCSKCCCWISIRMWLSRENISSGRNIVISRPLLFVQILSR